MNRSKPTLLASFLVLALLSTATVLADAPVKFPNKQYPDYPFSEAVAHGGVLYLSGEIGTGPDGQLVSGGIEGEARQTMNNIQSKLERHGLTMDDVIKCTVFLADIAEWGDFNQVYADYFEKGRFPARSALAASGLALNARVEVECLAAMRDN